MIPAAGAQFTTEIVPPRATVGARTVLQVKLKAETVVPAGSEIALYAPSGLENIIWPLFTNISVSNSGNAAMEVTGLLSTIAAQPPIWDNDNLPAIIYTRVRNQPLMPGDEVTFTLGNASFGELFMIRVPETSGAIKFRAAIISNDLAWTEAAVFPLILTSRNAASIRLFAPSVARTGEEVILKLSAWDDLYNRSGQFRGRVRIIATGPSIDIAEEVVFEEMDSGYVEIPLTFNSEGMFNIRAIVDEAVNAGPALYTGLELSSNFTWVQDDPAFYIYWGDLHSHSAWSRDGQGTGSFDYARHTSCLDYFSPAEHVNGEKNDTFGINEEEWQIITNAIVENHEPGRFVTVTAYETSYYANEGGHHNNYFEHHDSVIHQIPLIPRRTFRTIFQLWERLGLLPPYIRALSFPHFTGLPFYDDNGDPAWGLDELSINQGDIPRLVGEEYMTPYRTMYEIYSDHGQSEVYDPDHPLSREQNFWFLQDALAMGEKLGVTAFTDNHRAKAGHPGSGQGAVLAPALQRSEIFNSLRSRRTYGTTGERIIMDFRVNDTIMGGEVDIDIDMVPEIKLMVQGTAPLDRIEVLKWDFISGSYGGDYHPDFEIIRRYDFPDAALHFEDDFLDMDFYGHAVYYMRVSQKNTSAGFPVWGWSSPVWVNNLNLDTTILSVYDSGPIGEIALYPNPVPRQSPLKMTVDTREARDVYIAVYDSRGAFQTGFSLALAPGANMVQVPVQGLSCGHYVLRLYDMSRSGMSKGAAFVIQ